MNGVSNLNKVDADKEVVKRKLKSVTFLLNEVELCKMSEEILPLSILDTKQSHVLQFPLTVKQQLWLIFLLPAFLISAFYILDIATDIAIGCALINEKHLLAGTLTLLLMYTAPLISYLTSILNPPPENEIKVLAIWFLLETLAFILFPLRPLQCFSERLFWAIEALRLEDPLREEALIAYEETKRFSIEHYLFFQGILHAGPQILLQFVLLILGTSNNPNTGQIQVLCIFSSLLSLSMITMSYHRYETKVNGGRQLVWPKNDEETTDAAPELLMLNQSGIEIPIRKKWTKIMEEDDPLGKIVLFLFWFLFLLGRCLCLTLAATFFPWAVLGVCIGHYIFCLIYILPTTNCKTNILYKILLSFLYIFCLIEVSIQYRKSFLFHTLFFTFSFMENLALTILWGIWSEWEGWWYHYAIYFLAITHVLALIFLFIYFKYFQPEIRRIPRIAS